MNEPTLTSEFENKIEQAASTPGADPEFVKALRGRLMLADPGVNPQPGMNLKRGLLNRLCNIRDVFSGRSYVQGNSSIPNRFVIPTLAVIALLVLGGYLAFRSTTSVSAQQIIVRASEAQLAAKPSQGIWHIRIENYENPNALMGDQAGITTITDQQFDLTKGMYRIVTQDTIGRVVQVNADDGEFIYWGIRGDDAVIDAPIEVTRVPRDPKYTKEAPLYDPAEVEKSIFNQFRENPRVKLEGKSTWRDGGEAYVLSLPNYQTQKQSNGQEAQSYTGETRAVFDVDTYQLLEEKTLLRKDGKDVVIQSVVYLVNEILPQEHDVAWDLSDLNGITFVDKQDVEQTKVIETKTISEHELAARANGYVLKTIPEGFSQEIIVTSEEPFRFEINYTNAAKEFFWMQAIGEVEAGFAETNFYDGSYRTASGLVIYYSPSQNDNQNKGTSSLMVAPDGNGFLLMSTMSREQVQSLAEDLVPVK
jgi:hypothetical protein